MKRKRRRRTIRIPVSDFDLDMIRALQCAYYCHHRNIVSDEEYDQMEKDYEMINGANTIPVGSDNPRDYTEAQRALALYFLFSGHFLPAKSNPHHML
jgi:hypothetical protein